MLELKEYPIYNNLKEICEKLQNSDTHCLILTAETGAGKSTVLPIALSQFFKGKIIITEPRRLAVLGNSNRVSELMQEECGKKTGYRIALESKISEETKIEFVTEGILVRMIQDNPFLEGINVVVIDEFHERTINTDLNLLFLKEALEVRDDLYVLIMSATINTQKIQNYLSLNKNGKKLKTSVVEVKGRLFPVEIEYEGKKTIEQKIKEEIYYDKKYSGDILVFLPGIMEIKKIYEEIKDLENENIEVCILHSSISVNDQKKILNKSEKRRIILSSQIAETSLTIPNITTVIDSGLSRISRLNVETGMENLVTETESEFSANQRRGRAGRNQNGKCVCMWFENDLRVKNIPAEILRTDLQTVVLEIAERGIKEKKSLSWLDEPSDAIWNSAIELLKLMELLDKDLNITAKGKTVLKMGVNPRIGSIALTGNLDLAVKYSSYSKSSKEIKEKFYYELQKKVSKYEFREKNTAMDLLAGFPDRIAKKIIDNEYQFKSGRKANIKNGFSNSEWIVAPEVLAGEKIGKIFSFEELDKVEVEKWIKNKTVVVENCFFENEKVLKFEEVRFGKIVLSKKRVQSEKRDYLLAWENEIKEKGIEVLPLSKKTIQFIQKAEFYFQQYQDEKKEIVENVETWLPPFLNNDNKLSEELVFNALYWFLDGQKIESKVPDVLILSNGNKCRIKYEKVSSSKNKNLLIIRPVMEIIIQRLFGCFITPEICGEKVLFKLLSPANRPLQITDDLENFWTGAWPEICKEMKGKYPKHNWDYKIICLTE